MRSLLSFVKAVVRHWITLMSGGVVTVGLGIWERETGHPVRGFVYIIVLCSFVIWACFLAWREKNAELTLVRSELEKARKRRFNEVQFRSEQELYSQLTKEQKMFLKPVAERGHSVGKLTTVQHTLAQGIIDKTSWLTRDYSDPVYSFRNPETREIVRELLDQENQSKDSD